MLSFLDFSNIDVQHPGSVQVALVALTLIAQQNSQCFLKMAVGVKTVNLHFPLLRGVSASHLVAIRLS